MSSVLAAIGLRKNLNRVRPSCTFGRAHVDCLSCASRQASSSALLVRPEIIVQPELAHAAELGVTVAAIGETVRVATAGGNNVNLARLGVRCYCPDVLDVLDVLAVFEDKSSNLSQNCLSWSH